MVNTQQIVSAMVQGVMAMAVLSMGTAALASTGTVAVVAGAGKSWPKATRDIDKAVYNYERRRRATIDKAALAYRKHMEEHNYTPAEVDKAVYNYRKGLEAKSAEAVIGYRRYLEKQMRS